MDRYFTLCEWENIQWVRKGCNKFPYFMVISHGKLSLCIAIVAVLSVHKSVILLFVCEIL